MQREISIGIGRARTIFFLEIMEKRLSEYRETRKDGLKKARSIQDVMEVIVDFFRDNN